MKVGVGVRVGMGVGGEWLFYVMRLTPVKIRFNNTAVFKMYQASKSGYFTSILSVGDPQPSIGWKSLL